MKQKLIYLDKRKFNLMLERMEHRVNYDESVKLKKSLITEGRGGIGTIIKGFKNAGKALGEELTVLVRALDGSADDLDDLVRRIDVDPSGFKSVLNNTLLGLGTPKHLLNGLEDFVDNISLIHKSDGEDVYAELFKKMNQQGKNIDSSIDEIVSLWNDVPELLSQKGFDVDFPKGADVSDGVKFNHIKNYIISKSWSLPKDLRRVVDDMASSTIRGTKNKPLDELVPSLKNPDDYLVVSKSGEDGVLMFEKNILDDLGVRKEVELGIEKLGFDVQSGGSYKGTADTGVAQIKNTGDIPAKDIEELKDLMRKNNQTQKELLDVQRRGKFRDFFMRNKGRNSLITLMIIFDIIGLQFAAQYFSCLFKEAQGELRRVKSNKFNEYLRKRGELQKLNPNATKDEIRDNEELIQFTEEVTIDQCMRTLKYGDQYQSFGDYDPSGLFNFYVWYNPFTFLSDPVIRLFNSINLKEFIDLERIGKYVSAQIMVPIEEEIEERLQNMNIINILNFSCQGRYNKEDLRKSVETEFADEPGVKILMDIINHLDEDGEITDAAITTILTANEELAKSQSELGKLKDNAQKEFTGSMTIDTDWNGLKGGKGADLKSQAIRACLRGKGLAFTKSLSAAKGIQLNINDILLYTDGKTTKKDILNLAKKQVNEGINQDYKSQLNLKTSNADKNVKEAINLLKYLINVCENSSCSGVKDMKKTVQRFESINFDDKYLSEQWNTVVGLVGSGDYDDGGGSIDLGGDIDLGIDVNFSFELANYTWQRTFNGKSDSESCAIIQAQFQDLVKKHYSRDFIKMLSGNTDLIDKRENIDGEVASTIKINDITITELAKLPLYGWCKPEDITEGGKKENKNVSNCTTDLLEFVKGLSCYEE